MLLLTSPNVRPESCLHVMDPLGIEKGHVTKKAELALATGGEESILKAALVGSPRMTSPHSSKYTPPPPPPPPPPPSGGANQEQLGPSNKPIFANATPSSQTIMRRLRGVVVKLFCFLMVIVSLPLSTKPGQKFFGRLVSTYIFGRLAKSGTEESNAEYLRYKEISDEIQRVNENFIAETEKLVNQHESMESFLEDYEKALIIKHNGISDSIQRLQSLKCPSDLLELVRVSIRGLRIQQGVIARVITAARTRDIDLVDEYEALSRAVAYSNAIEASNVLKLNKEELDELFTKANISNEDKWLPPATLLSQLENEGMLPLPLKHNVQATPVPSAHLPSVPALAYVPTPVVAADTPVPTPVSTPVANDPKVAAELAEAILKNDAKRVEELLKKGASTNIGVENGEIALVWAVRHEQYAIAKLLLAYSADANKVDLAGNSPLMYAAVLNDHRFVELLMMHYANPTQVCRTGLSPIMQTIIKGHNRHLKIMLDHGTLVNVKNDLGQTPLMIAAKSKNVEAAKMLLLKKAEVNLRDGRGNTPLIYAAISGSYEIARILIENKASRWVRNNNQNSAFDLGKRHQNTLLNTLLRP